MSESEGSIERRPTISKHHVTKAKRKLDTVILHYCVLENDLDLSI